MPNIYPQEQVKEIFSRCGDCIIDIDQDHKAIVAVFNEKEREIILAQSESVPRDIVGGVTLIETSGESNTQFGVNWLFPQDLVKFQKQSGPQIIKEVNSIVKKMLKNQKPRSLDIEYCPADTFTFEDQIYNFCYITMEKGVVMGFAILDDKKNVVVQQKLTLDEIKKVNGSNKNDLREVVTSIYVSLKKKMGVVDQGFELGHGQVDGVDYTVTLFDSYSLDEKAPRGYTIAVVVSKTDTKEKVTTLWEKDISKFKDIEDFYDKELVITDILNKALRMNLNGIKFRAQHRKYVC